MEEKMTHCVFNKMVDCDCDERRCVDCGWNPAVAERRVDEWCAKRAAAACVPSVA